jgi:hypothetical protein
VIPSSPNDLDFDYSAANINLTMTTTRTTTARTTRQCIGIEPTTIQIPQSVVAEQRIMRGVGKEIQHLGLLDTAMYLSDSMRVCCSYVAIAFVRTTSTLRLVIAIVVVVLQWRNHLSHLHHHPLR